MFKQGQSVSSIMNREHADGLDLVVFCSSRLENKSVSLVPGANGLE